MIVPGRISDQKITLEAAPAPEEIDNGSLGPGGK